VRVDTTLSSIALILPLVILTVTEEVEKAWRFIRGNYWRDG